MLYAVHITLDAHIIFYLHTIFFNWIISTNSYFSNSFNIWWIIMVCWFFLSPFHFISFRSYPIKNYKCHMLSFHHHHRRFLRKVSFLWNNSLVAWLKVHDIHSICKDGQIKDYLRLTSNFLHSILSFSFANIVDIFVGEHISSKHIKS